MSSYQKLNTVSVTLQDIVLDMIAQGKFSLAQDVILLMIALHEIKAEAYPEEHEGFLKWITNGG